MRRAAYGHCSEHPGSTATGPSGLLSGAAPKTDSVGEGTPDDIVRSVVIRRRNHSAPIRLELEPPRPPGRGEPDRSDFAPRDHAAGHGAGTERSGHRHDHLRPDPQRDGAGATPRRARSRVGRSSSPKGLRTDLGGARVRAVLDLARPTRIGHGRKRRSASSPKRPGSTLNSSLAKRARPTAWPSTTSSSAPSRPTTTSIRSTSSGPASSPSTPSI